MPITDVQKEEATAQQNNAAHDENQIIRLIAGPGTGKTQTIQERVAWLLQQVDPASIYVVSFTRATAFDLRLRIRQHCRVNSINNSDKVNVSTLHSLALKILRRANRLVYYHGYPTILDDWELDNVYDNEFSTFSNLLGENHSRNKSRCKEIRIDFEAFCGTSLYSPPNFIPPDPPISEIERQGYRSFHSNRSQIYSCLLPGELVKNCADQIDTGNLDVIPLLGITNLIVDEYQDLNPVDQQFIDLLINQGIVTFIAGDDDQSIYSFRYASPKGLQSFASAERHPNTSNHEIEHCFRCTTEILATAQRLFTDFPEIGRIQKNTRSLYANSNPPVPGIVHRWYFETDSDEASAIVNSCRALISRGIQPDKILILLANTDLQLRQLTRFFDSLNIPYENPKEQPFINNDFGRLIFALFRIIVQTNDYFAYRLLLGLYPGIGLTTCTKIANIVLDNTLNYRDLFFNELPNGVFNSRQLASLTSIRQIIRVISSWDKNDTLSLRVDWLNNFILTNFGGNAQQCWHDYINMLPNDITLEELCSVLGAISNNHKKQQLNLVYERLGLPVPDAGVFVPKIRIMTMHGAKGLSGEFVFIPGLEEKILPGQRRLRFPNLINESMRMLYVSITRAKVACFLTYARRRYVYNQNIEHEPSRFNSHLNGRFIQREIGLQENEIDVLMGFHGNL